MKKIIIRLSALLLIIASICCIPANGAYNTNGSVVLRFDSVTAVARAVASTYGVNVGCLGGSMQCRFFTDPGIVVFDFDDSQSFSADVYKYVKVKYFANTYLKDSTFFFATRLAPNMDGEKSFSFKRGANGQWNETVIDLTSCKSWTGYITSLRFDVITRYSKSLDDQYAFIEYIAFFRSEAEANAYGGLSEAQANGTDLISRYAEGYRTSRIDGITYTVPGKARDDEVVTAAPVTEPPITEPPATEPPVTEPPATEPPATEPPTTEPPATDSPASEVPVTEPPATDIPETSTPISEPTVTTVKEEGKAPADTAAFTAVALSAAAVAAALLIIVFIRKKGRNKSENGENK